VILKKSNRASLHIHTEIRCYKTKLTKSFLGEIKYIHKNLKSQRRVGWKCNHLFQFTTSLWLRNNKNLLPHKLRVSLKTSLSLIHAGYSAMCPIKEPTGLNEPHCREAGRKRYLQFEWLYVNFRLHSFSGAAVQLMLGWLINLLIHFTVCYNTSHNYKGQSPV
jgi:hypothetical protein